MSPLKVSSIIVVILILFVGMLSIFTVNEGHSALLLRLGKIVKRDTDQAATQGPGLHFKVPFIDKVRVFDMRTQELATPQSRPLTVVTKEQTYLQVEYFAKWRIDNLPKFYTSTGGSVGWAEKLLEQRINDLVRAEFGRRTSNQAVSLGRADMMAAIRKEANSIGQDQGISVIDVAIRQITLPEDVLGSVFSRMETERKQFAEAKRAGGERKSEEIRALADQKVTVIKAEALMKGAELRAKGDMEAATIYAEAFGKNPKFYDFYRSLEAYENSFNSSSDLLVLRPEGKFFNYFNKTTN